MDIQPDTKPEETKQENSKPLQMIVLSNGSDTYIGYVQMLEHEVDEAVRARDSVYLEKARLLLDDKAIALPACSGPVDIYIMPTIWFLPDQDAVVVKKLEDLLNEAETREISV